MSAIAASTVAVDTAERPGKAKAYPVAASTLIPAGVLVATNSSGNAVNASDAASIIVQGVAEETKDNSAGSAGDLSVTVRKGVFKFTNSDDSPITAAHVGKLAYVESNVAVAASSTNKIVAGRVLEIDADLGVWVDTADKPVKAGAAATSNTITDSTGGSVSTSALAAMSGVDGTGSNAAPLTTTKNSISTLAAELVLVKADLATIKTLLGLL